MIKSLTKKVLILSAVSHLILTASCFASTINQSIEQKVTKQTERVIQTEQVEQTKQIGKSEQVEQSDEVKQTKQHENVELADKQAENTITDELAESLDKKILTLPEFKEEKIEDFLITDEFIQKNSQEINILQSDIEDFLITDNFILKNSGKIYIFKPHYHDYFAEYSLKKYKNIVYKRKIYDFQNLYHTYIKVHSARDISTKQAINAGDKVYFYVDENVKKDGKTIVRKGEKITARIETISESGLYGVPADIIIGNFKIRDIPIEGEITKEGFTHTYWIIPVSNVASFFIPFSGQLFRFIHGGHAKIKTKDTFELQLPDDFSQEVQNGDGKQTS